MNLMLYNNDVVNKQETKSTNKPARGYQVKLLNSDFAEFFCVIVSLKDIFGLSDEQAYDATNTAHTKGSAVIGAWSKDIAETKVQLAMDALVKVHSELGLEEPSMIYLAEPMDD
jgi:ATP-dependent Clp protease adaptor protein ClpS